MERLASIISAALLASAACAVPAAAADRVSPFPEITRLKGPEETTVWRIEPAVLRADTVASLDPVQIWADEITRQVPAILGDTDRSRAAYDRIMEALFEWAGAEALTSVQGETTRALLPRRVIGGVTAYLAVKPIADATNDIRKPAIERWIHDQARFARAIYGGEAMPGMEGTPLNYRNNLQATAATLAMETYLITGDASLRDWAMTATRAVLDEIDAAGFTSEIRRTNPQAAEYFGHETMIFVVATAKMAADNGDASLWTYRGAGAGAATDPAILRAGALLGADLGGNYVTKRHAVKTGLPQNPYRKSYIVTAGADGLLLPEGWLTCWIDPFLAQYGDAAAQPGLQRLRVASDYYRLKKISQFNGSVPLRPAMTASAPLAKVPAAQFE